jgi:diguanylate cyclase (GGDEF)-like protein
MEPNKTFHQNFIRRWFNPRGKDKVIVLLVISALIVGITLLVFLTGGTVFVYPHLLYIPIILSALFFRVPGGFFTAIICGLIMGPMMPLNISTGEMQPLANWLVRTAFFIIIGSFAGVIFSSLDKAFTNYEWQLQHDLLTMLPNRSYLTSELEKLINEASPKDKYAVIIFLINNAHEISNLFGLDNADKMLLQISERIRGTPAATPLCFLASSICGFVVHYENQEHLEETIINSIESTIDESFYLGNIPVFLDISIGIALYPRNFHDPNILVRKAKSAAYTAHEQGTNYWYFKDEETLNKETLAILGSIHGAIKDNQFSIHYQPIIDLAHQKLVGLEALIRWRHPEFGMIPPMNFLPKIETTSLIYQVQEWVFRKAFFEVFNTGIVDNQLFLSVNLSARGLVNYYQVGSSFYKLIDEYKIAPERIILEITETTIMTDQENSFNALSQLRDYGVKIAIDDFGAGYSSLNYIKSLPADYIKIDQNFIREIHVSQKDQEIVKASLSISNALGFKSIAEGVECEEGFHWLQTEGCQYAQGYYIGHPMPIEKLPAWIKAFNS